MVEVFDEKLVDECLSEVADSNIKMYAYYLLDWAVQKRKIQAIPLDKVKQAREEIENRATYDGIYIDRADVLEILDKLIAEREGE